MTMPSVSVIIPTLEAEQQIQTLLQALKCQSVCPAEIIIIDSHSQDRTKSIAEALGANVIVIDRSAFNHGLSRNLGASKATGEILVFMTQDALPDHEYTLHNLIQPIIEGRAAAAYARQKPRSDADPVEQFWRSHNYPQLSSIKDKQSPIAKQYFFSNVCSAFRKDIFVQFGGFQRVNFGEDTLMAYTLIQAGHSVAYQSSAAVIHSHNHSTRQKWWRYYDTGVFNQLHPWLTEKSSHEKEGIATVQRLLAHLWKQKKYQYIPIAAFDMLMRYIAYACGRMNAASVSGKPGERQTEIGVTGK